MVISLFQACSRQCLSVLVLALAFLNSGAFADELLGATEAMKQIAERMDKPESLAKEDPLAIAIKALKEGEHDSQKAVAEAWMNVVDVWSNPVSEQGRWSAEPTWNQVMRNIPGPEAWPEIAKLVEARELTNNVNQDRRTQVLRMLAACLTGDDQKLANALERLEESVGTANVDQAKEPASDAEVDATASGVAAQVEQSLENSSYDWQRQQLRQEIGNFRSLVSERPALTRFESELKTDPENTRVPDLVQLLGVEKAEERLLEILKLSPQPDYGSAGKDTLELARRLAVENFEDVGGPVWSLCQDVHASELFEKLSEKFGSAKSGDFSYDYWRAAKYYLIHLIVNKEDASALAILKAFDRAEGYSDSIDLTPAMELEPDRLALVYKFLERRLKEDPGLKLWNSFHVMAVKLQKSGDLLALVEQVVEGEGVDEKLRQRLLTLEYKVLLSEGEDRKAVDRLRIKITSLRDGTEESQVDEYCESIRTLMLLGRIRNHRPWIDEALDEVERFRSSKARAQAGYVGAALQQASWKQLKLDKDYSTLERLIIETAGRGSYRSHSVGQELLSLYLDAGRYDDVIKLLKEYPDWNASDIDDFLINHDYDSAYAAAFALAELGDTAEATAILSRLVMYKPSSDKYWELALAVHEESFPELSAAVFKRDPFEERPLIWLATWQLNKGDLDAAEKTVRRAIEIDPSDGEKGKGDRMRVYAVLADILEKKGNADFKVFRGAVSAIRMAEDADDLAAAGLLGEAIQKYEKSLELFSDAYCIQSRLAIAFAAEGNDAKALKHYERAFELMPDSFGRVESHCFGCEGIFAGDVAATAAEDVFQRRLDKDPGNARLLYLLGQLRDSQSRYKDALEFYRRATSSDPEYLNAWSRINELYGNADVPKEVRSEACLALLKLAPLRFTSQSSPVFDDFSAAWRVAAEAKGSTPVPATGPLWALDASAKSRSEAKQDEMPGYSAGYRNSALPLEPGEVLLMDESIESIGQIMRSTLTD